MLALEEDLHFRGSHKTVWIMEETKCIYKGVKLEH